MLTLTPQQRDLMMAAFDLAASAWAQDGDAADDLAALTEVHDWLLARKATGWSPAIRWSGAIVLDVRPIERVPMPELPLPGETFDGDVVVASVWLRDTEPPITALVLLLGDSPSYYRVAELEANGPTWKIVYRTVHANIVPAVRDYESRGGDY